MSNYYVSPNMSLPIPVPTVDTGPDWANNLNGCLNTIDAHTHNSGSGVQVTPSGLNLNADVTFLTNNAIALRSVRFNANLAPLALAADLGCLYESGVDLYYNDGNGNQIRITQSGSVAGASGTITGLPSGTASAAFSAGTGTFIFQQATSTAANMDAGTLIVRYPGSYPTPSGNYIAIQAPSALSSGYALTLPSLPAQTNVVTLGTSGILSSITYDAVGQGMTSTGANAIGLNMTTASAGLEAGSHLVVVASTNPASTLCIIRGNVTFGGAVAAGEGFTSSYPSPFYQVNFSSAFADTPAVTVTGLNQSAGSPGYYLGNIDNLSTGGFRVYMGNSAVGAVQTPFMFIAIGRV